MLAMLAVALIGAAHAYILWIEMFRWETPRVMKTFRNTPEMARATRVMAANQGLYNGFLAAGLFWSLLLGLEGAGRPVALFFLGCVLVAGVYGGATAMRVIYYIQAVPAAIGILLVLAGV